MTQRQASFTTFVGERAHTCGVVVDCRDDAREFVASDLARLATAAHRADARAFGKVAVLRHDGVAVYQTDAGNNIAPVFCGNATAAALRFLHQRGSYSTTVRNDDLRHNVRARITANEVAQSWLVPRPEIKELRWRGQRVILIDTLNPYALIVGRLPDDTTAEAARNELVGAGLASKLAVIGQASIEFYNANGRHGAAPQTGLATMALAARAVPWFAELLLGMPSLPPIAKNKDGRLAIAMPTVTVELRELALPQAA